MFRKLFLFVLLFITIMSAQQSLASTESSLEALITDGKGYVDRRLDYTWGNYKNCELKFDQNKPEWSAKRLKVVWDLRSIDWENVMTTSLNGLTETAFPCENHDSCIDAYSGGDKIIDDYISKIIDNGDQTYFIVKNYNIDSKTVTNHISKIRKNCERYNTPQKDYNLQTLSKSEWQWGTLDKSGGEFKVLAGLELMDDTTSVFDKMCSNPFFSTINGYEEICANKSMFYPHFDFSINLDSIDRMALANSLVNTIKNSGGQTDSEGRFLLARAQSYMFSPVYIMGVSHDLELEFDTDPGILSYWHLNGAQGQNSCKSVSVDQNILNICEYPSLLSAVKVIPTRNGNGSDWPLIHAKLNGSLEKKYGEPFMDSYSKRYWNSNVFSAFTMEKSGVLKYSLNNIYEKVFHKYLTELQESRLKASSSETQSEVAL